MIGFWGVWSSFETGIRGFGFGVESSFEIGVRVRFQDHSQSSGFRMVGWDQVLRLVSDFRIGFGIGFLVGFQDKGLGQVFGGGSGRVSRSWLGSGFEVWF